MSKLISFDFDDTLCLTPIDVDGKSIWKERTGTEWPYNGWWSKPESLWLKDPETGNKIFDIPVNEWVYKYYLKSISDENNHVVLVTGRIEPLRNEVKEVLRNLNLSFEDDDLYLNWGGDTFKFKTKLFTNLIIEEKPEEFIMYDDRQAHLPMFVDWALLVTEKFEGLKITVVDVVNKTSQSIVNGEKEDLIFLN
jgi:hypothetical protein